MTEILESTKSKLREKTVEANRLKKKLTLYEKGKAELADPNPTNPLQEMVKHENWA